jgi:hypothetical protein
MIASLIISTGSFTGGTSRDRIAWIRWQERFGYPLASLLRVYPEMRPSKHRSNRKIREEWFQMSLCNSSLTVTPKVPSGAWWLAISYRKARVIWGLRLQ